VLGWGGGGETSGQFVGDVWVGGWVRACVRLNLYWCEADYLWVCGWISGFHWNDCNGSVSAITESIPSLLQQLLATKESATCCPIATQSVSNA
jgi:hypothetical protein